MCSGAPTGRLPRRTGPRRPPPHRPASLGGSVGAARAPAVLLTGWCVALKYVSPQESCSSRHVFASGHGRVGHTPGWAGQGRPSAREWGRCSCARAPSPGFIPCSEFSPFDFQKHLPLHSFQSMSTFEVYPELPPHVQAPPKPELSTPPQAAKVFQMLFCSLPPLYFLLTVGSRPHFQRTYIPFSQETVQVIQVEIQHYHLPQSHECLLLMSDYLRSSAASPK